MAYYDRSIKQLQGLIDGLEDTARLLHRTNTVQTTKLAGLVREGKALVTVARDEMIIDNYRREREIARHSETNVTR